MHSTRTPLARACATLIFSCVTILPTVAAQATPASVSPRAAANGLAGTGNRIPFSWIPTAYQQVHHRDSFSSSAPRSITVLWLRMAAYGANQPGNTIDVELHMGLSPTGNVDASPVFARNVIPGTEVEVFARKGVNLPTVPDNSWAIPFHFDVPFAFTGTAHLSWRAHVWGNGNNGRDFDYPLDAWGPAGDAVANGPATGCSSATGTRNAVHTSAPLRPGDITRFDASSYVAAGNLPALLGIGLSNTAWGPVSLPLDLTAVGAPGCFLGNDLVAMLGGVTQPYPSGAVAIAVTIPEDRSLAGASFYTQFVFLQAAANPLGLFTTNSLRNTLGRDHGVARIAFAGNPAATSGFVDPYYGLAIGLW